MRFWDTSALVPLLLEQEATAEVGGLLSQDPEIVAWWGTPVECVSAAARLRREDRLSVDEEERVLDLLDTLQESWLEILPSEEVRDRAVRLLRVHGLKAADALQLAAARVWAGSTDRAELVTYDERLAFAARLEGFRVLPV
ncbi:MAG: type II toxin-antitoxin system VapC family toxin [Gemmatimonadetes bacterium]|nr:type II toxin-antitoxin system VapC family toxin [Gemmatimonadota bacterium]